MGGRPVRGCGGWVQWRATRRRCQPITVAGLTISITSSEPAPVEGTRQHGQDRPVGRGEPRSLDLALEDEDLMAKSEDLGVTLVTGHEQQPEPSDR